MEAAWVQLPVHLWLCILSHLQHSSNVDEQQLCNCGDQLQHRAWLRRIFLVCKGFADTFLSCPQLYSSLQADCEAHPSTYVAGTLLQPSHRAYGTGITFNTDDEWELLPIDPGLGVYRVNKRNLVKLGQGDSHVQIFRAEKVRHAHGPVRPPLPVAIKLIRFEGRRDVDRQAAAVKALKGMPFFVEFHGLHTPPDDVQSKRSGRQVAHLIMGLVEGPTLHDLCISIHEKARQLQPGPELDALKAWTWHFSIQLADNLLLALTCLHKKHGYFHRDLNPRNISIRRFRPCVVVQLTGWCRSTTAKTGREGTIKLAWPYVAPELLEDFTWTGHPSVHNDMLDYWAVGTTLHFALSCTDTEWHRAFEAGFLEDKSMPGDQRWAAWARHMMTQHQEWAADQQRLLNNTPGKPHQIVDDVHQAALFAVDNQHGWPSAAQVLKLLRKLLHTDPNRRVPDRRRFKWLQEMSNVPLTACPVQPIDTCQHASGHFESYTQLLKQLFHVPHLFLYQKGP